MKTAYDHKTMATIECVRIALASAGPLTIGELISECRTQAYAGKLPEALNTLLKNGIIQQDDDDAFVMVMGK